MKRKVYMGFSVSTLMLLGAAAIFRGQEPPEPPLPPVPPHTQVFSFSDGRGWLGVRLSDLTAEKARELKLPGESGAVVTEVVEDSPAAKAGVMKNDVILEFAGERVRSVAQLQRLVRETPLGRTVALQVSRGGQTRSLSVKLEGGEEHVFTGAFTMPKIDIPEFGFFLNTREPSLGVSGEELTRQLADFFGVKQGKGVLVREVVVGSAAEKAGLKAGDVIVRVEGKEVGSPSELRRALPQDFEEKRKVAITIVRDRREQAVTVELEPPARRRVHRVERIDIQDFDPEELRRMSLEAEKQAREVQRELMEQSNRLKEEWQRELKNNMDSLRHLRGRVKVDEVI